MTVARDQNGFFPFVSSFGRVSIVYGQDRTAAMASSHRPPIQGVTG